MEKRELLYVYRVITRPVAMYGGFILSMLGLNIFCQLLIMSEGVGFSLRNFTEAFLYMYLLSSVLCVMPKFISKQLLALFYIVFYLLAFVDVFCHYSFDDTISPALLMLLSETNVQEASEFMAHFLNNGTLFTPALAVPLYLLLHLGVKCFWKNIRFCSVAGYVNILSVACVLWLAVSLVVSFPNIVRLVRAPFHENISSYEANRFITFNPATRLLDSVIVLYYIDIQSEQCLEQARSIGEVDCCHTSPTIVLIIGESYSKHHAQLYGYALPTTPHQVERQNNGRLFRFDDVVSTSNHTDYVFKELFSSKVVNEPGEWSEAPLFPCVMRAVGYKVSFFTNEFFMDVKMQDGTTAFGFNADFFINEPQLSEAMFDFRNDELHTYDEGLLADFRAYDSTSPYNLIIFQLRGQHLDYDRRFPEAFKRFTSDDYLAFRSDLAEKERSLVADYDNATLYNDAVVDSICRLFDDKDAVVIYLSDHGEEIYEKGRGLQIRTAKIDAAVAKYQYEVPFWIYCTERYAAAHPEVVSAIDAARRKRYMTDAIPHLIYGLAGIGGAPYKAEYDLLNEKYDSLRTRLLRHSVDYDAIR